MSSTKSRGNGKVGLRPLGVWLRELRRKQKLPLRAVAAAAEMDQAHLSKVELGQRLLTAEQAAAIATFFRLDGKDMEARRIAEKFRMDHADNPAALQALEILNNAPLKSVKNNS
jgi:transcriptional regulator with XRE-family HTH domain